MSTSFGQIVCGWIVLAAVLLQSTSVDHPRASDTSSNCSVNELAQNSSVVLTWTLHTGGDGDETFTRISHTSESLLPVSSSADTGRLVIIGGIEYESAQPVVTNPLLVYNLKTNAFAKPTDSILSSLSTQQTTTKKIVDDKFASPASRADHASFVTKNVVYLFGGQNKEFLNDTWRLCVDDSSATASWDQLVAPSDAVTVAAAPAPRIGHSFTQVFENSTMIGAIVYGGVSDAYVELEGLHMAFITKASSSGGSACSDRSPKITWRMLPTTTADAVAPAARAYHSAMVVSKLFSATKIVCLLVYGGKNTQKGIIFDELWRLCPPPSSSSSSVVPIVEKQVHVWELLTPIGTTPGARYGASVSFVDEGKLALAGGSYTFPNDFLRDTWELNINATQWIRLRFSDDFTPPRRGHSLTFFSTNSLLVLFGGKDRYTVVQRRMESTRYAAPFCATGFRITLCESTGKYVCIPCPAGLYLQSGTRNCLPCGEGTFSYMGSAECTKCPAGTFSTLVGKTSESPCTQCPVGTSSSALGATSLAACTPCTAGTFAASAGSTACSTCSPGTFSSGSAGTCTKCDPGQWSASGAQACQSCAAGSHTPYSGSPVCFACPKGFYSDSGADTCLPCPLDTYSDTVSTASITGCRPCPSFSFAAATAQTRCTVCPSGSSFIDSSCQLCSAGLYASEETNGACLPCPKGYYSASVTGAAQCRQCPQGSTTSTTGARSLDECTYCTAGYFLDGAVCNPCPAGTFPSSPGFCSECAPGGYTSSATEAAAAQLSGDCRQCSAMTYASAQGATRCDSCADGSFSLTGWKNCIACGLSQQQLVGCKAGRNGVLCSGNGDCIYGGCACTDGWTGADCSVPVLATGTSSSSPLTRTPAVLYFPTSQNQLLAFPTTTLEAEIAIQIARSGKSDSSLQALLSWSSSNFTSSGAASGFPKTLTFGAGETMQTITIALSSLTPRSGCRFLTLVLADASNPSTSAVSVESDRSITLYLDDMNGVGGGTSGRSISANYVADYSVQPTANVTLDRVVVSQATLSPFTSSGSLLLQNQRMNIAVAIDRRSASAAPSILQLLPALVAKLQTRYQVESSGIQMGLLLGNVNDSVLTPPSVKWYLNLSAFFLAAQELIASSTHQEKISWEWIAASLSRNASAWPTTGRRFVWVIDDTNQLSLSPSNPSAVATACQTALRAQSAFAFVVRPSSATSSGSASTIDFAGVSDIMQGVFYEGTEVLPSKMLAAYQTKDATLSSSVDVLKDPYSLTTSTQVRSFASGSGSLPVLGIVFKTIPAGFASTDAEIVLGIPGLWQLTIRIAEPSHACFRPVQTQPTDPHVFSGWMESWSLSSLAEITRKWDSSSPTIELRLYQDTSLLRTATSAILAMTDPQSTRMTLRRTLSGMDFSAGLKLAVRGYMKVPRVDGGQWALCQLTMAFISVNATVHATIPYDSHLAGSDWRYGWVQRVVPWDLESINVTLDCNTSAPGLTVEWTTLGLLPDPDFACACPRGFFHAVLDAGNSSSGGAGDDGSECVRCPAGSYCAAGMKRRCPDGSFSFGKSSSCETCRDGWMCIDGLARLCNPGTFASPLSTCEVCPAGFACRNGKKASCPIGTFSSQQASECQSCPPGTISRVEA